MATPRILLAPRRTDEQSLAFRATVSPPHLRRKLPTPALPPLPGPSPAQVLRQLAEKLNGPRASLYRRTAERALESGDVAEIQQATRTVQTELDRCRTEAEKMHRLLPKLYPKPAA